MQPYVALALASIIKHGHRVRIATHPTFRDFVIGANARLLAYPDPYGLPGQTLAGKLEFYDAGGDPKSLMEYMVKSEIKIEVLDSCPDPRLWPGIGTLASGDIGRKKKMTAEMLEGFYESTYAPDTITGKPFAADAIISNPPVYAHFHIAEALGIPLHMTFSETPPSSTGSALTFSYALDRIIGLPPSLDRRQSARSRQVRGKLPWLRPGGQSVSQRTSLDPGQADATSMWHGLGGVINQFRKRCLLLGHIHQRIAPSVLDQLKVPWTYCWSPDLLPKPDDWRSNIDISGFYFLDDDATYDPPRELADFLADGPAPIYIGFGSIPIPKPKVMIRESSALAVLIRRRVAVRCSGESGYLGNHQCRLGWPRHRCRSPC